MNNNKLIAEFMGMKYSDKRSFNDGEWTHSIRSLSKFQTSWDWMMPVGERIDAMFGEDDEVDDAINRVHNAVLSFDIDNTYRAIVEFIEEYNESNKMDNLPPHVQ